MWDKGQHKQHYRCLHINDCHLNVTIVIIIFLPNLFLSLSLYFLIFGIIKLSPTGSIFKHPCEDLEIRMSLLTPDNLMCKYAETVVK